MTASITDATVNALRAAWGDHRRARYSAGRATATEWITKELPAAAVYSCGGAAMALAIDDDELDDPTTCWKWVIGHNGNMDSHAADEIEASDIFWRRIGADYDAHFGRGFISGIFDAYVRAFCVVVPDDDHPETDDMMTD